MVEHWGYNCENLGPNAGDGRLRCQFGLFTLFLAKTKTSLTVRLSIDTRSWSSMLVQLVVRNW